MELPRGLEHALEPGGRGVGEELPLFGERDGTMAPAEQAHTERRFELPNRSTDGGLGLLQFVGGTGERLTARRDLEDQQVIDGTGQLAKFLHQCLPTGRFGVGSGNDIHTNKLFNG